VPAKINAQPTTSAITVANSAAVHHSGCTRVFRLLFSMTLTSEVEVAGLAVIASERSRTTSTAAIIEVRTARPTASPTPAGPPDAVKP
jgi:hypothetical protein